MGVEADEDLGVCVITLDESDFIYPLIVSGRKNGKLTIIYYGDDDETAFNLFELNSRAKRYDTLAVSFNQTLPTQ